MRGDISMAVDIWKAPSVNLLLHLLPCVHVYCI
jgi:hypothetical protein